jgi:hypothetical protein
MIVKNYMLAGLIALVMGLEAGPAGAQERKSIHIPDDKSFHELTEEQRQAWTSYYRSIQPLEPGDEPPYPLRGLLPIKQSAHAAARRWGPSGTLKLLVDVDENGKAVGVGLVEPFSNEPVLHHVAGTILATPFKPALCKGAPCARKFPYTVVYATD